MKREYFSGASKEAYRNQNNAGHERCIALVDARYLVWLAQHTQTNSK
ncbi:MAG: hypothetical protein RIU71_1670, partial [Pseudomonadota bacterium]